MFRKIDQSPALARLIEWLSTTRAKQRGLPIVVGVILIAISFVFQLIGVYANSQVIDLLWGITHHLGLIIAFIGVLLVEPLGK